VLKLDHAAFRIQPSFSGITGRRNPGTY
jgi:hypothetical protein